MHAVHRAGLIVALLLALIDDGKAQSAQEFTVLQRVVVGMEYHWKMPKVLAAVQWTTLREATGLSVEHTKVALAGFLYARTIVNHAETRRALIERTQPAATGLVQGGERFAMDDWRLEAGGRSFPIYPWQSVAPDRVQSARTYTAYLIERLDGLIEGHLEMAWGYERILAPAAPLIVFEALAKELPGPERVLLGRVNSLDQRLLQPDGPQGHRPPPRLRPSCDDCGGPPPKRRTLICQPAGRDERNLQGRVADAQRGAGEEDGQFVRTPAGLRSEIQHLAGPRRRLLY